MNEFDAEYERQLDEARERAHSHGRDDVVAYLNLRAANDALRAVGIEWLLETFSAHVGDLNRAGAGINVARTEAHRFKVGNSTMVGSRLVFRTGLRTLTVEAGWPRGPRDGIVRGGGLASGLIEHFGNRAAGEELLLVPSGEGPPRWLVLERTGERVELREERVRRHFTKLFI
ncbi:MAG: hypothetical protein LC802_17010 [Acidobacteria bacterium]|nr:hypothetical protein [Acidobacteriota bacterium]